MSEEFDALVRNDTWELVPPESAKNIVGCKWIFRIKRLPDGSVERYKARLVAKGFHQRPDIDYHDTFSPLVKPTTVRLVLFLTISHEWCPRQLNVNNAFLYGTLTEDIFMAQPQGFTNPDHPNHVCRLRKATHRLKQAPQAWYNELKQFLLTSSFLNSTTDTSLFILCRTTVTIYLLVYVDDIIITGNNPLVVQQVITLLSTRFSLKDLGPLTHFLGVEVFFNPLSLILSQKRYIADLLAKFAMTESCSISTLLPTSPTLSLQFNTALSDPSAFCTIVDSL